MKILTININSIRAHIESFMKIVESGEYDVICVQELKCEHNCFPHNLFDVSGYNIKVFGQKSYNGVAIFSKQSIEDEIRSLPNYGDSSARFLECVIGGKIRLINIYMPNGESMESPKFPGKLEWMEKFGEYIKKYLNSEEPVIIAGDFNVAIEDIDVWSPKAYEGSSISAPAARKIMQEWLSAGWMDAWRHINEPFEANDTKHHEITDKRRFTWYGYRGYGNSLTQNHGLRLDYFLLNKTAHKLLKNCYIDMGPRKAEKPTDHTGLVLELKDI